MKIVDGKVVYDSPEEEATQKLITDAVVKSTMEAAGLTKPQVHPGIVPDAGDQAAKLAEKDFAPPEGREPKAKQMKRVKAAALAISGGRLALEDAPKEIKFNRYVKAMWDGDQAVVKALSEGAAVDGLNLVPTEFSTDLLVAIEDYGIMRRDADIVPMTRKEIDLRTVTTKPLISRAGELIASTESATKFGKPQLVADVYTGHQIISREELDDNNVGLLEKMVILFGEQFAKAEDYEGLVNTYYPGVLGSVTPTTTTLVSTSIEGTTYPELIAFLRSLSPGQLAKGGKLYMHRTILGVLESILDKNGRPIVQDVYGSGVTTIKGYPVELSEIMPALSADAADTPFIIFGNLKWVAFGDRWGLTAQLLKEATMPLAGGGSVNLASQRAQALAIDIRWGINVTIPANLAYLKTHA